MDHSALLISQVTDIFRIGLLVGLLFTMERTRPQTGVVIPLLAGIVFVAFIIPATMPKPGIAMWRAVMSGLVANAAILAVLWAAWSVVKKRI